MPLDCWFRPLALIGQGALSFQNGRAPRGLVVDRREVMHDLNTEVDEIREEKMRPTPGERLRRAAGVATP